MDCKSQFLKDHRLGAEVVSLSLLASNASSIAFP